MPNTRYRAAHSPLLNRRKKEKKKNKAPQKINLVGMKTQAAISYKTLFTFSLHKTP